jgi:hypothetical protein
MVPARYSHVKTTRQIIAKPPSARAIAALARLP